jgi:4Fe-4S ferredoxin
MVKRYKKEVDGKLEIGQILYTKKFKLTLDRDLCKGCELCKLICPRDAVKLVPQESEDNKTLAPIVDIDENKCDYHGICAVICPFTAIRISINGNEELPTVKMNVFPTLTRDIEVDTSLCEKGCTTCQEVCPLNIVTVMEEKDEKTVEIDKDHCAACRICWMECPTDAIEVRKFIEGNIQINSDLCPKGCQKCLEVCPVDAVGVNSDGKVYAKDMYCIYCGACRLVCPEEKALEIERTAIIHSPIDSGAWHRGLEKVTSARGLKRELSAEGTDKVRNAIKKLNLAEVKE